MEKSVEMCENETLLYKHTELIHIVQYFILFFYTIKRDHEIKMQDNKILCLNIYTLEINIRERNKVKANENEIYNN